jgi:DNA-binding MarR family transcriptional regulator
MTGKSSDDRRAALLADLDRETRQASALGVMFSQIVAARLGITGTDLECLDLIGLEGVMTAGKLAEATGLTTGAVTGILDRLESAGFARRERDPNDRRKVLVRALPSAEERIGPYYRSLAAQMGELLARYSDAELELVRDFLAKSHAVMVGEVAKLRAGEAETKRRSREATEGDAE